MLFDNGGGREGNIPKQICHQASQSLFTTGTPFYKCSSTPSPTAMHPSNTQFSLATHHGVSKYNILDMRCFDAHNPKRKFYCSLYYTSKASTNQRNVYKHHHHTSPHPFPTLASQAVFRGGLLSVFHNGILR